jgi:hypothetical protein
MGVGESQALLYQPVQVGGGDSAGAIETGDIAVAHVVGEYYYDVRDTGIIGRMRVLFRDDGQTQDKRDKNARRNTTQQTTQ